MDHHALPPRTTPVARYRSFGLAQMGASLRLAIVVPVIGLIWVTIWLLVQS